MQSIEELLLNVLEFLRIECELRDLRCGKACITGIKINPQDLALAWP